MGKNDAITVPQNRKTITGNFGAYQTNNFELYFEVINCIMCCYRYMNHQRGEKRYFRADYMAIERNWIRDK